MYYVYIGIMLAICHPFLVYQLITRFYTLGFKAFQFVFWLNTHIRGKSLNTETGLYPESTVIPQQQTSLDQNFRNNKGWESHSTHQTPKAKAAIQCSRSHYRSLISLSMSHTSRQEAEVSSSLYTVTSAPPSSHTINK